MPVKTPVTRLNLEHGRLQRCLTHNADQKEVRFCIVKTHSSIKRLNGVRVGDLFMSLIHTCELNKADPFDYLTELLRHAAEIKANPAGWMPWNYRDMLSGIAGHAAA